MSATNAVVGIEASQPESDAASTYQIDAQPHQISVTALEGGHRFAVATPGDHLQILVDGEVVHQQPSGQVSAIRFFGSAGDDTFDGAAATGIIRFRLNGGAGNDLLEGGANRDTINGGTGDDVIFGHAGNDVIRAGSGDDVVDGGAGRDRIFGAAGEDSLNGGTGPDRIKGGMGNDVLVDDSRTTGDTESAGSNAQPVNVLKGGLGNDVLVSNGERDLQRGGSGNDELNGDTDARLFGGTDDDSERRSDDSSIVDEILRELSGNKSNGGDTEIRETLATIDVTITDLSGVPVSELEVGQEFLIQVDARDHRQDASTPGVQSAVLDLFYQTNLIRITEIDKNSTPFASGNIQQELGLVDEAGSFNLSGIGQSSGQTSPFRVITLKATATKQTSPEERLTIEARQADARKSITAFPSGSRRAVDISANTTFGRTSVSIVDSKATSPPVRIESRIVRQATATDDEGRLSELPSDVDIIGEWENFYVEYWVEAIDGVSDETAEFVLDIPYDRELLIPNSTVEFGPLVEQLGTTEVDQLRGIISGIRGQLTNSDQSAEGFVLLARAEFRVRSNVGVPANALASDSVPRVSFTATGFEYETSDGRQADVQLRPGTEIEIHPVASDLNDDGAIDFSDLSVVVEALGTQRSDDVSTPLAVDFDGDDVVTGDDLSLFLANFLTARRNEV